MAKWSPEVHRLIDVILSSLLQFKGYPYANEVDWDGGSYYDNFIDGAGY